MKIRRLGLILFSLAILTTTVVCQQSKRDEGIDLYRQDKFSEAAAMLEQAVATDKSDSQAWLYLGAAYVHLNQAKDAKKAFGKSRARQATDWPKYDKKLTILSKPNAKFYSNSNVYGTVEKVMIAIEFRADGTIGIVFPFRNEHTKQESNALDAAKRITFTPAMQNGKPITVVTAIEYAFSQI